MPVNAPRPRALRRWAGLLLLASLLGGCDFIAKRELKPGQSSREEVVQYMGKPEMVWEDNDGSQQMEYVRGPMGDTTWMVDIGPDGKYRGMRNVLTEPFFAQVRVGMARDDVRRILGKPGQVQEFRLKNEVVWSWRYRGDGASARLFHVHFGPDARVVAVSTTAAELNGPQ